MQKAESVLWRASSMRKRHIWQSLITDHTDQLLFFSPLYLCIVINTTVSLIIVGMVFSDVEVMKWCLCFSNDKFQRNKQQCVRPEAFQNTITVNCFLSLRHKNIITNLLWAKAKSTVLGSPWKLYSSEHILWMLYGVVCSSQRVWLRLIRCMAVCTMGIQPCIAGGLAEWRQYKCKHPCGLALGRICRNSHLIADKKTP